MAQPGTAASDQNQAMVGWFQLRRKSLSYVGYLSTLSFMGTTALPSELPELFSYTDARRHGLSDRQLRNLNDQGAIEKIGRGLFSATTLDADPDLIEVAFRSDQATMCLTSALARHGLTDEIPATIDLALPRGTRAPATSAPITWHKFDPKTFDLGREEDEIDPEPRRRAGRRGREDLDVGAGYRIGLYSAERSICDAFRIRHLEGTDQAVEALKRWLRRPGSQPSQLLELATAIGPKAAQPIRAALQILL